MAGKPRVPQHTAPSGWALPQTPDVFALALMLRSHCCPPSQPRLVTSIYVSICIVWSLSSALVSQLPVSQAGIRVFWTVLVGATCLDSGPRAPGWLRAGARVPLRLCHMNTRCPVDACVRPGRRGWKEARATADSWEKRLLCLQNRSWVSPLDRWL